MAASSEELNKIIHQAEKDLNTYQAKTGAAREQYDDPAGVRSLNENKFPGAEVKYQGDDLSTNASYDKRIPPNEGGDLDDRGRQAKGGQYDHHEGRGDPKSLAEAKFNENPGQNDGDVVNTTLGARRYSDKYLRVHYTGRVTVAVGRCRDLPAPFVQPRLDPRRPAHQVPLRPGDEAAKDHPEATIYRSASDLFADPNVDLVVVSTPPQSHYDFVPAALTAGKHVVVEKPFCPTSAECDKLIALAKARGRHLAVFQNRRWDVDFVTLRHLLSEDRLGRVVEFASHYDRFDPSVPPRDALDAPGSGVIFDLGTHLFDQVLQLYGSPEKVTAFLSHQRPGAGAQGPADACTVLLHYPGDLLVTVKASPLSADEAQLRFWARGEKGSFKKYHIDSQEPQLVAGMKTTAEGFGYESADKLGLLTTYENGVPVTTAVPNLTPPTYAEFYNLLDRALDGKGRLPVTAEEARDVIKLVELSKESSKAQATLTVTPGDFLG